MQKEKNGDRSANIFTFTGKTSSVNNWHKAQAVRRGKKWSAMIYEGEEYKTFKHLFGASALKGLGKFQGYVDVSLIMYLWKVKDTDGPIKAMLDGLEAFGVIENDKFVRNLYIERHYHKKAEDDMVAMMITPVSENGLIELEMEQKWGYKWGNGDS